MHTSARNQFAGTVTAIAQGAVNDEIEMTLPGGEVIVAVITRHSTQSLGLKTGSPAFALIKASWVILARPQAGIRLSTRNRLEGTVKAVKPGAVNAEVEIALPGGNTLAAIVTMESVAALGLAAGEAVVAFFKASQVIVGVSG
ncbi:TOBE domain-containing protein [Silvimonas iriomotensis]|uniref:Mop domain-containing protein n=1 Tax=Silvimonas iriomotensis TaxID=449662 RepID=A0ABQ2PAZ3_9NEIS|nr:TOBE domain-containing protein [Silvimonas iriomotensis]GGP22678.1 hypothetical protein GCM10010970_26780 [Silvimonas iriomotensis]